MKFYLAGKISDGSDWRPPINTVDWGWAGKAFPIVPLGISHHEMTGPFYLPDSHGHMGFARDESTHGLDCTLRGYYEWEEWIESSNIPSMCLDAIRRCDVLFAWIDTTTCYGTLVEIGFAHALGREIWIAGSESTYNDLLCTYADPKHGNHRGELWFAAEIAQRVECAIEAEAETPLDVLRRIIGPEDHEARRKRIAADFLRIVR